MSDVIALDNHRLLCGNAQVKSDVDKLLDGVQVDLLLTDPPYGIDIVNPVGGGQIGGQGGPSIRPFNTHTHTPNGTIGGAKPPTFKRNSGNTSKTRVQERERERANGKVGKPRRC